MISRIFFILFFLFGMTGVAVFAADKPVQVSSREMDSTFALQKREKALAVREEAVTKREKEMTALQKEVDAKLEEVNLLQKDIETKLAEIKQVQDASFKSLIKVYSSMKASKLAPLLNQMSDEDVAHILRALKTDQVAQLIPKIEGEKAVSVSRLLGRF